MRERSSGLTRVGLRIDVCTYGGLCEGVPRLLEILARCGVHATFFATLGPDRSGRAIWRLFRKRGFLSKMLRTRALSMYGWRTALYGTLLPAPRIGERCAATLRRIVDAGHELGVHSWDHVTWQDRLDRLSRARIDEDYRRVVEACRELGGVTPRSTAAPAWLSTTESLLAAEERGFEYASDTRGRGPFVPFARGRALQLPQVPSTLPTLDEVLGRDGRCAEDFMALVFDAVASGGRTEVLTVHAEAEGRAHSEMFERLLERLLDDGMQVVPLRRVLEAARRPLPVCAVERREVPGRAGKVSIQGAVIGAAESSAAASGRSEHK